MLTQQRQRLEHCSRRRVCAPWQVYVVMCSRHQDAKTDCNSTAQVEAALSALRIRATMLKHFVPSYAAKHTVLRGAVIPLHSIKPMFALHHGTQTQLRSSTQCNTLLHVGASCCAQSDTLLQCSHTLLIDKLFCRCFNCRLSYRLAFAQCWSARSLG